MKESDKSKPLEHIDYYDWLKIGEEFTSGIAKYIEEMQGLIDAIMGKVLFVDQDKTDYIDLIMNQESLINRLVQVKGLDSAGLWINELPPKDGDLYPTMVRCAFPVGPCEYDLCYIRWKTVDRVTCEGFYHFADHESLAVDNEDIMCHARLFYNKSHDDWARDVTTKTDKQTVQDTK